MVDQGLIMFNCPAARSGYAGHGSRLSGLGCTRPARYP